MKKKITYCIKYGLYEDTYKTEIIPLTENNVSDLTNFLNDKLTEFIFYKHIYNERYNK